jgi:sugar lactone lactonase YvrE
MAGKVEVLVDDATYTESPRWRDGVFWFSDIGRGEVCRVGPNGKEVYLEVDTASGLGWTQSGDLLVASIAASTIFRAGPDRIPRPFCGPAPGGALGTNDMATVGSRSYVTCSGRDHQPGDDVALLAEPIGKIVVVDHDTGAGRVVASGLRMPNGVAVTADGKTLMVAEIFANRLLRFDIRADGSLSEPRVFREVDHGMDGICLDAEGAVWASAGLEQKFHRIDVRGNYVDTVEVPGWMCIAPMLGGADGRTLYMAVSQADDADAVFDGRARSRIVTARVDVPACPAPAAHGAA